MRRLSTTSNAAIVVAIVTSLVFQAAPATAATKVFLLAGQSNMVGVGGADYGDVPIPPPYDVPQTSVHIWNNTIYDGNTYGNGWAELQQGFGYGSGSFGPEVTFGYTLDHTILPADDIYLVKYALGGTHLSSAYNEWNVNVNGGAGGALYKGFKSYVNGAMQNLTNAGRSPTIAGMIWMQGESDANNATYAAEYAANLTDFINRVRSDFAVPNMPFVVGRITTHYDTSPPGGAAAVRAAQMTVPGKVGHASWINTDDLQQNPTEPWHYGTQGQIDLGKRFANRLVHFDSRAHPVDAGRH